MSDCTCQCFPTGSNISVNSESPIIGENRGSESCQADEFRWVFFITSLSFYLLGIGVTKIGLSLQSDKLGVITTAHSGEFQFSRLTPVSLFAFEIASLIIYFVYASKPISFCVLWNDHLLLFDTFLNSIIFVFSVLRFCSTDEKLKFWFTLDSIVDVFTIPTTFVSLYLNVVYLDS